VASTISPFEMKSARMVIPAVDEDSRQDGQRWGGLLSYWLAEAASYTGTKPKFAERQLVANKLTCLMYATEELLEDDQMLKSYADRVVPDELAFQIDNSILQGSGAGQPLGVWNSPATIQQAIVGGETSISAADILAIHARAFAPYRKDAVWFINQSLEPKLYPLTVGSPSLGQYLLYKPAGEGGNARATMMGHPVVPIEQASAPGVVGDITLFCPDGYLLAKRNEVRADSSIHVAFLTGEVAFRWMLRLDGQPWWKKPLQPYYPAGGTAPPTVAAFVTLGARSGD
jgi:HK97 family phage major capsid protein